MTHEEAIEELKKIDTLSLPDGYLGKMDEALKMAIEAMQTEPCEDCISRRVVLNTISEYDFDFPQYMERFVTELRDAMKKDLAQDIGNLPSVQPEPFINKPCVSEQACHEDKMKVLDKIESELWMKGMNMDGEYQGIWVRFRDIERIIDKYKTESEDEE